MDRELALIEQLLSASSPPIADYTPPAIADLIERLDAALHQRRAA
ncbi:hypothetical protein ACT009_05530 [Sphingomonas sp. Tas61C01]